MLESLPISPWFKRRIKEEAVTNYLTGERQKALHPFNVAPTYRYVRLDMDIYDYGMKVSIWDESSIYML